MFYVLFCFVLRLKAVETVVQGLPVDEPLPLVLSSDQRRCECQITIGTGCPAFENRQTLCVLDLRSFVVVVTLFHSSFGPCLHSHI